MSGWDVSSTPTWGPQDGPEDTQASTPGDGSRDFGQDFGRGGPGSPREGFPEAGGGFPGESPAGTPPPEFFGQEYGQDEDLGPSRFPQRTPGRSLQDLPRRDPRGRHSSGPDGSYGQDSAFRPEGSYGQENGSYGQSGSFGQETSSYGQDAFGQEPPAFGRDSAFGQEPAFGQESRAPSFSQEPAFGQEGNSYGQAPSYGQDSAFGQEPVFGQESGLPPSARSRSSVRRAGLPFRSGQRLRPGAGAAPPTRPRVGAPAARTTTAAGDGPPGGRPHPGMSARSRTRVTATRTVQASASRTSASRTSAARITRARHRVPASPRRTMRARTSPVSRVVVRRRRRALIAGTATWSPGWIRRSRTSSPRSVAAARPAAPTRDRGGPASPGTRGTGRPPPAGKILAARRRRAPAQGRAPCRAARAVRHRSRSGVLARVASSRSARWLPSSSWSASSCSPTSPVARRPRRAAPRPAA